MKYLKYFESTKWDPHQDPQIKIHLETINDLFLDVVDEFDLYKRTYRIEVGDYYDIFHWEYYSAMSDSRNWGSKKIRLIIKDDPNKESEIEKSKSFLSFLSRLRSLGYDVQKWDSGGICYDINYSNLI